MKFLFYLLLMTFVVFFMFGIIYYTGCKLGSCAVVVKDPIELTEVKGFNQCSIRTFCARVDDFFSQIGLAGRFNGNSGITGVITLGPTCPVVQASNSSECQDKTLKTRVGVYRLPNNDLVTEFSSKDDGSFKVALPSGKYRLKQMSNSIYPRLNPQDFTVLEDIFSTLNIHFDTGIR